MNGNSSQPRHQHRVTRGKRMNPHIQPSSKRTATDRRRDRLPVHLPDPDRIEAPVVIGDSREPGRSDDEIAQIVNRQIRRIGKGVSGRIVVRVNRGTITLRGMVRSAEERLVLLSCVEQARTDGRIVDRLEVVPIESRGTQASSSRSLRIISTTSVIALIAMLALMLVPTPTSADGLVRLHVTVSSDKGPAAGAFLTLYPESPSTAGAGPGGELRPQGRVDTDGLVTWTTFQPGDGVPPGAYIVTAIWSPLVQVDDGWQPGPNCLDRSFASVETTPLRLRIPSARGAPGTPVVLTVH